MAPLRVAIAGTGNIARAHAKALAAVTAARGPGDAALVAVMDVDESQLDSFGAEFGVRETYLHLTDLLSQGRPDLVHVCTPPATHYPLALGCLRAGADSAGVSGRDGTTFIPDFLPGINPSGTEHLDFLGLNRA